MSALAAALHSSVRLNTSHPLRGDNKRARCSSCNQATANAPEANGCECEDAAEQKGDVQRGHGSISLLQTGRGIFSWCVRRGWGKVKGVGKSGNLPVRVHRKECSKVRRHCLPNRVVRPCSPAPPSDPPYFFRWYTTNIPTNIPFPEIHASALFFLSFYCDYRNFTLIRVPFVLDIFYHRWACM